MRIPFVVALSLYVAPIQLASAGDLELLLDELAAATSGAADATNGAQLWTREVDGRSCATCHQSDVGKPGRHARTGKPIEPMAPSVNPKRLTDRAEMDKWLLRNCKWTFGRECTASEQADILSWLAGQ